MAGRSTTKLTLRSIAGAEPRAAPYILSDAELPGFSLRVLPAGGKHYILRYRTGGQRRLFTIGRHGAPWTPESARKEAKRLLGLVASGQDPQAEKEQEKQYGARARAHTVRAVTAEFIEQYAKPRNRTWPETQRIFNAYVNPVWGERPIASITRADVDRLIEDIARRGAPVMANRTLAQLRKLFNWAVTKPRFELAASPVLRIAAPGHERSRSRYLSDEEIRSLWQACEQMGYPFGPFTQLLLLTLARREVVAAMRRPDIDRERWLWTIPAAIMKSGRPHVVPLSGLALGIIDWLPVIAGTEDVFPARRRQDSAPGERHVSGFSKAKARLDVLSGVTDWTFHDLRRTATTHMGELRVPRHIRKLLLDHAENDVTGIYDRYEYLDERREALERWAAKIEGLIRA